MITNLNHFDRYDEIHEAISVWWTLYWASTDETVKRTISERIDALREQAYDCIPYGAVTPNRAWNGKRAYSGAY